MLKVGVIGVGNCGGQIAAKTAELMLIDAIALNTSDQDLEKLNGKKGVITMSLGDKKGAGQNRSAAKEALKSAVQQVLEDKEFKTFIQTKEVLFIVSSTGGGTGSGISPLLYFLISQMTDAIIILVGVLPTLGEDRGIQVNELNYLNELYNTLDDVRYMLYDNNRLASLPATEMMEQINTQVANDIQILSGYYNTATEYASIDDEDGKKLLSPTGMITVASARDITEKDLDTTSIEEMLVQDLKTNSHCELDRDGVVEYTGIILNLSERINRTVNMNTPVIYDFVGEPRKTGFKHIHVNDDEGIPNNAFFIASGLSPVNDRIRKTNERINEIDAKAKDLGKADALKESKLEVDEAPKARPALDIAAAFERFGVK